MWALRAQCWKEAGREPGGCGPKRLESTEKFWKFFRTWGKLWSKSWGSWVGLSQWSQSVSKGDEIPSQHRVLIQQEGQSRNCCLWAAGSLAPSASESSAEEWVWFTTTHQEPLELGFCSQFWRRDEFIPWNLGWVAGMDLLQLRSSHLLFSLLEPSNPKFGMHRTENIFGLFNEPQWGVGKGEPKGNQAGESQLSTTFTKLFLKTPRQGRASCWGVGSINLCRTGFMENVLNFLNPQLFQMSSITDRIFPRAFQTLYEACSCLHSN